MKFRVWDYKYSRFEPNSCRIDDEGDLWIQTPSDYTFVVLEERYEISRSPGLLDKNGTTLYTGDLVRFVGDVDPSIDSSVDICELIYDQEKCCFYLSTGYSEFCIDETVPERIEYVGNKYEN